MEVKKCKVREGKSECPLKGKCARADEDARHYFGPLNASAKTCVHLIQSKGQTVRK